ncbi:hypothetical protein BCR35DRAFT_306823 [Leucosporidium creatinivorum]|uniref:RRM domain-containing protein n=1 Tax=Leucosporidium creatinivorum TaxID=106004 RepID=A0A1Y2ESB2_9BASI|nr:hypothetical protein BCR35DRAFT_306823 [Leucosporidium creatinivorum]
MAEAAKTVYVGGFDLSTRADTLHTAFSPFGDIVDIQLPPDPSHQSKHRGFAFITYSSNEAALDAIDNMHRNILPNQTGRPLKVNMDTKSKARGALKLGGSNKAIWTDEAWLKEHGTDAVGGGGAPAENAEAAEPVAMEA